MIVRRRGLGTVSEQARALIVASGGTIVQTRPAGVDKYGTPIEAQYEAVMPSGIRLSADDISSAVSRSDPGAIHTIIPSMMITPLVQAGASASQAVQAVQQIYPPPYPMAYTGIYASAAPAAASAGAAVTTSQIATSYYPRVSVSNLTRPGQVFQSGDEWLIQIGAARPNAPVSVTAKRNGNVSTSEVGRTDAGGFFQLRGRMSDAEIGSWEETWRIAPEEAPRLTFTVTSQPAAAQPPAQPRQPATEETKQEQREATPSWLDQIKAVPWWIWAAAAGGMAVMSALPRRAA